MINVARELQHNKQCNQIIIAILAIILTLGFSLRGLILTVLTFSVFLFYIHRPFFLAPAWDHQTPNIIAFIIIAFRSEIDALRFDDS